MVFGVAVKVTELIKNIWLICNARRMMSGLITSTFKSGFLKANCSESSLYWETSMPNYKWIKAYNMWLSPGPKPSKHEDPTNMMRLSPHTTRIQQDHADTCCQNGYDFTRIYIHLHSFTHDIWPSDIHFTLLCPTTYIILGGFFRLKFSKRLHITKDLLYLQISVSLCHSNTLVPV